MNITTLYLDTSVIGGYFDAEWMTDTRELWAQALAGQWKLAASVVTEREVRNAPENVRQLFATTFGPANILDTSADVEELAGAYLAADVVRPRMLTTLCTSRWPLSTISASW